MIFSIRRVDSSKSTEVLCLFYSRDRKCEKKKKIREEKKREGKRGGERGRVEKRKEKKNKKNQEQKERREFADPEERRQNTEKKKD